MECYFFFFSSRRRHTRCSRDWSSDVCSSDLLGHPFGMKGKEALRDRRVRNDAPQEFHAELRPHRLEEPRTDDDAEYGDPRLGSDHLSPHVKTRVGVTSTTTESDASSAAPRGMSRARPWTMTPLRCAFRPSLPAAK